MNNVIKHIDAFYLFYKHENDFLEAMYLLKDHQANILDVYSPYPIEDSPDFHNSYTSAGRITFLSGLAGILFAATIQIVIHRQIILFYGSKPVLPWFSFSIFCFTTGLLFASLGLLGWFAFKTRLMPGQENFIFDSRLTQDHFCIVIDQKSLNGKLPEHLSFDELKTGTYLYQSKSLFFPIKIKNK